MGITKGPEGGITTIAMTPTSPEIASLMVTTTWTTTAGMDEIGMAGTNVVVWVVGEQEGATMIVVE